MSMIESCPEFGSNGATTRETIDVCENLLGVQLPDDYVQFLLRHNGGEGFVGEDSYLILWRVEELEPFNREYQVKDYCPGLLFIGSSGGGEAYGFDTRTSPWNIVQVPFIGMENLLAEPLGSSFEEFIGTLARGEAT